MICTRVGNVGALAGFGDTVERAGPYEAVNVVTGQKTFQVRFGLSETLEAAIWVFRLAP